MQTFFSALLICLLTRLYWHCSEQSKSSQGYSVAAQPLSIIVQPLSVSTGFWELRVHRVQVLCQGLLTDKGRGMQMGLIKGSI